MYFPASDCFVVGVREKPVAASVEVVGTDNKGTEVHEEVHNVHRSLSKRISNWLSDRKTERKITGTSMFLVIIFYRIILSFEDIAASPEIYGLVYYGCQHLLTLREDIYVTIATFTLKNLYNTFVYPECFMTIRARIKFKILCFSLVVKMSK